MPSSKRRSSSKKEAPAQAAPRPTTRSKVSAATAPAAASEDEKPTSFSRATSPRAPAKSVAKAKAAFANFTLSKFARGTAPANYVDASQSTATVQQQIISSQLTMLPQNNPITVALSSSALQRLLPSYNETTGTVAVDEVVNALELNMRGTEFYANGNPTLNRLAIQSQVQAIIADVIRGAKP